jgi:hypothetical protein
VGKLRSLGTRALGTGRERKKGKKKEKQFEYSRNATRNG